MCIQLLHMVQGCDQPFQDYMVALLAQNSLLMGMTSHLSNAKLHHQLEVGLELHLSQKIENDTVIAALDADNFMDWSVKVKHVNDALHTETVHFEGITTHNCERSRCKQLTLNNHDPARKILNNNNTTATSSALFAWLPKLTNNEHTLLMDNHGCLKCHCVFAYHVLKDCPNDWPNTMTYCPVTAAGKAGKVRKGSAAAVMSGGVGPSLAVADVLTSHLVAYVTSNMQSIIDNNADYRDSNDSIKVSSHHPPLCTAMIFELEIPVSTSQHVKKRTGPIPFFEPHLWWWCLTSASDFLPQTLNALIDPGSHAVLICEDLINSLLLCHQTLHKPEIKLAMTSNEKKAKIVLWEYMKLKLYDPSNYWQSQTVHVLITQILCAPVLLGLPFLVHNNIVIDHVE